MGFRRDIMEKLLPQTWNLDVFFAGGSQSPAFSAHLDQLEKDIAALREAIAEGRTDAEAQSALISMIQSIAVRLKQAGSFTACLTAQDVKDEHAVLASGRVKSIGAAYQSALTKWEELLLRISDEDWQELLRRDAHVPIAFPLEERRRRAKEKLPPDQEVLANDLAVDGYHGWQDLYNIVVGRMTIEVEHEGKVQQLSVGQTANLLSHPDRGVRERVFAKWTESWAKEADLCAQALNHLGGYRLQLYRHRGWDSVIKEPLDLNRMSQETLDAMWAAIDRRKDRLVAYLQRKAKLLGVEKLSWHDVGAPLGSVNKVIPYDEAAAFILEHFGRFSPKLRELAEVAFTEGWVEAEDRPGKRPGGFCTSFPVSGQSRIFMTYAGNTSNVSTLAHELGHAFHQHIMSGLPPMAQNYAMNVAETASTFAEMIVVDAAVRDAASREERIALLEDKLQQAVAYFMNIQARFIFEKHFYAERKNGLVSVARLNQLMEEAQKTAYGDALADYEPHFWASKLHFYITSYPFYNFPYTFGYLFSLSLYARSLEEGAAFEEKYVALLRDTGRLTVEELAKRHLGVDLTNVDFWQAAVDLAVADIEEFLRLT
jgi:oligoendopeptidase F